VDLPLVPVEEYLSRTLYDDDYEVELRPELRLMEPIHRAMPDSVAQVYGFLYEGDGTPVDPVFDTTGARRAREMEAPMLRAIERGAYADAVVEARRVVSGVLDVPAALAGAYGDALRDAVEMVDVAPRLAAGDRGVATRYFRGDSARDVLRASGSLPPVLREALEVRRLTRAAAASYAEQHPQSARLGSLTFVALQEAMRAGIPDGWAGSMDSVPAARWSELDRLHNEWLRAYPTHPMADYVRLSRVRLAFFRGDRAGAWNELLDLYPRHRERVLGEMAYLMRKSTYPPSLDDPRIDWPLRAALVRDVRLTPNGWTAYWRASEAHITEPWAIPLQERLLWQSIELARGGSLPEAFPRTPRAPSALWAKLRLIALLQAGDIEAAFAQADSTADSVTDVGAIRARLHLLRREWARAIAAADKHAAQYLLRVVAPMPVVDSLAAASRSPFATEARLTIAGRRALAGDWVGARRAAAGTGTARVRLWASTAKLAADTSRAGALAFARLMRDRRGELFFGESTYWLRGLNWRRYALTPDTVGGRVRPPPRFDVRLPWTPDEELAKISAHIRSSTELYYSLRAYARWLDGASATTPGLAAVVREADQVYNRLVNWDENNSRFWSDELASSPEARSIRRAGALLRKR
jgi:hypothetical protein